MKSTDPIDAPYGAAKPRKPRLPKRQYFQRKTEGQIARAQTQAKVLERRLKGETWIEIGAALGIEESAARRAYQAAIASISAPQADQARLESIERIGMIPRKAWQRLRAAPGEHAEMLAILIRCEERIAKLLGLDPKTPLVEITAADGLIPLDVFRQAVADADMKRRAAPAAAASTSEAVGRRVGDDGGALSVDAVRRLMGVVPAAPAGADGGGEGQIRARGTAPAPADGARGLIDSRKLVLGR
jgi:hypothetical protein